MRALRARHVQRQFHFREGLLQLAGSNSADNGSALVAYDLRLIADDDAVQAAAAVRIAKIRMRQRRCDYVVHIRQDA